MDLNYLHPQCKYCNCCFSVYTNRESLRIEEKSDKGQKPRAVKHSVKDFLVLIVRLLFYTPVWTTENQNRHNVRFLYVNFSAWHFAGSDMLWAGIAIRLFNAMQMNFGKLQLSLYRVTQYDKRDEVKAKEVKDIPNNWISKKVCCCPLWFFLLFIIVVPVVLVVVFFVWVFPNAEIKPEELETEANSEMNLLEGFAIASLGVPAVTLLRFAFQMVKNLIFSQEQNIKRGMDNERISNQLGFMNEVRKEMWFLTQFIKFMEVFERRRIRIVLKITHLDRCSPKKIVGVLEAINILLSDEKSPVLSILAVNPNVLLKKVKFAENCFCKEDRAHALLNRIVTLGFTVPPMCENSKRSLFNSLNNTPGFSEDSFLRWNRDRRTTSSIDLSVVAIEESKESNPLINTNRDTLGSIKRELALIRGTCRLENSGWMRNIAPLPVTSLIKMTTDDICEEMERMKLDSMYRETVKKHKLNGSALVFGDTEDLKVLLGMTFGEWATFKQHFLSFVSPDENMLPLPAKIHLSKFLQCVVKT
uniref:NTPase, KAP family P-loop domain containing 1 n=1 Tax=Xiphophorus couchianus TaxID=32473 RepID=A0A3B5L3R6_9TELE